MHVGYALALEDAGSLELDVLGPAVPEQLRSLAQQHRHDVYLELVEAAGIE
jgi:hypothetical protein